MPSSTTEPAAALGGTVVAVAVACLAACGSSGATAASLDGGADARTQLEAEAGAGADGRATDASVDEGGEMVDGASPSAAAGIRLFFSDLLSGPATGGQDGKGAFVTVWGNGFGAARGTSTVTVGGGAVSRDGCRSASPHRCRSCRK